MRMPPLLADFSHARACKPFCEKYLTLPKLKAGIVGLGCVLHFVLLFVLIDFLLIPFPAHRHRLLPLLPGHRKSPCFQYISGAIMGHMLRFRHL